ncbi:MAG: hypothetical protein GX222_04645 [Ruminococcaceae bacterium]|nr:hypothetical protein [Oscillospiraceae bacterium]
MTANKKPILNFLIKTLMTIILFVILTTCFFGTEYTYSIYASIYFIGIILSGIPHLKALKSENTPLEFILFSFSIGIFQLIILYLVLSALKLYSFFSYIPLLSIVISLIVLYLKRKAKLRFKADAGELNLAFWFALIALIGVLISLTSNNTTPIMAGGSRYHVDLLNSVGLVDSASRGFPFEDVKAAGIPYNYHVLSFAILGVLKSVSGIDNFSLITLFSLTVFTPFFAACVAALSKRILGNSLKIAFVFVAIFILSPFDNMFLYYLYSDTLGFSLSAAFGALSILALLKFFESKDKKISSDIVLCCITLALSTFAKGPVAAVYVLGFGMVFLVAILREKKFLKNLVVGGMVFLSFFFVYLLIYTSDSASLVTFYPGRFIVDTEIYSFIRSKLHIDSNFISIVLMFLTTYIFMFFGILLQTFRFGKSKNNEFYYSIFAITISVLGFLLTNITHQYGGSEIYFVLAAYPFSVIILVNAISSMFENKAKSNGKIPIIVLTTGILAILILSALPSAAFFKNKIQIGKHRYSSINASNEDRIIYGFVDDSITEKEYEALIWIRDNTDRNAIVASERAVLNSKYMYGTAFSERRFFLEGYIYITSYDETSKYYEEIMNRVSILEGTYSGNEKSLNELKQKDVDYIILSKRIFDDRRPFEQLQSVYENEDIEIFKL